MNIGITCYPTYGGSGVVAVELGKSLAARGHKVHFISYALPMRLDGLETSYINNIFYHEVEMPNYPLFEFQLYSLALASKMAEVATFEKLDVLHVHYAIPHAVSAYLAKQILGPGNGPKIVTTLHGTDITLVGLEPSFLPLVKFSINASDGVTAVSRFLKEKTETGYTVNKNIEVIPNFIDGKIYKRVDCSRFKKIFSPNGEKILIHVSNFRPVKRVTDVVKIFQKVREKVPSKLVFVGDGPDRSETERLCRELHLHEDVKFLGKQQALVEILSAADLFLMPSQSESFGLSALEAMACEVPVVASSVGGIPEVVAHNETGFVAEFGDVDRMARYAIELLTDEKKHTRFALASRKRAIDLYSEEKIVTMYEALYERLLAAKEHVAIVPSLT